MMCFLHDKAITKYGDLIYETMIARIIQIGWSSVIKCKLLAVTDNLCNELSIMYIVAYPTLAILDQKVS